MSDRATSRMQADGTAPALDGIRVVDFTHFIAGPISTRFLGDMGADIIKIENAAGETIYEGLVRACPGRVFRSFGRTVTSAVWLSTFPMTAPDGSCWI